LRFPAGSCEPLGRWGACGFLALHCDRVSPGPGLWARRGWGVRTGAPADRRWARTCAALEPTRL